VIRLQLLGQNVIQVLPHILRSIGLVSLSSVNALLFAAVLRVATTMAWPMLHRPRVPGTAHKKTQRANISGGGAPAPRIRSILYQGRCLEHRAAGVFHHH